MEQCPMCSIKKQAIIHILILPDEIKADSEYHENIYKLTREKIRDMGSDTSCDACKRELKIIEAFRQNCLYSEKLMNDISSNIADNHRVLIDNVFIDVILFEGLEDFYVSPINVTDQALALPGLIEETRGLEDIVEEDIIDDVVFEPIEEVKEVPEVIIPTEEIISQPKNIETPKELRTECEMKSPSLVKPKDKLYKCDKCKKQYATLSSLDMHRWKWHKIPLPPQTRRRQNLDIRSEKDIYFGLDLFRTCEYCFLECSDGTELKSHLETIHKDLPRKYTCKMCLREFKTRETLRIHYLTAHTDERREFKCQHCDKTFFHKRSLQTHEEIQHLGINAGRFICDICGQKSNSRGDLNRHKLRHDKIKAHLCPYEECGKRFATKYQLTLHKKYHDNIRVHKCNYCDRSFVAKCSLNDHLQVHLKEKKYFCDHCENSFSRKRSLDKHLKVHYGIRDFMCNLCPYKCRSTDQLKQHKKVHEGFRPFSCLMCTIAFKDIGPLKRHQTIVHGINAKKDDDLDYQKTM